MRSGVQTRSIRWDPRAPPRNKPDLLLGNSPLPVLNTAYCFIPAGELKDRLDHMLQDFYWDDTTGFTKPPNYKRLYNTVEAPAAPPPGPLQFCAYDV